MNWWIVIPALLTVALVAVAALVEGYRRYAPGTFGWPLYLVIHLGLAAVVALTWAIWSVAT